VEGKVTRHTGRVDLVRSKSFSLVSEVLAGAESEIIGRRGMEMTQRNQPCLAEIAGREQAWNDVLSLTKVTSSIAPKTGCPAELIK
jgi:hypothetical protein